MRYGHIDKRETYADLLDDHLFAKAFAWLRANPNPLPRAEAYPIAGDDAYAKVISFIPQSPDQGRLETHHKYVDLQIVCGAKPEGIMYADAGDLRIAEDHPGEQDVTFYHPLKEATLSLIMHPGHFVIFATEKDAHMPQRLTFEQMRDGAQGEHLKVVIKILKSALAPGLNLNK